MISITQWPTVPEAAAALAVAERTIYRWVHDGTVPATRLHGRWRIRPDYEDVLAQQRTGLSVPELAEHIGCSVTRAYQLVRAGVIPATQHGGRAEWRIDPADADGYLDAVAANAS